MTTSVARRAVIGATWLTAAGYLSFLLSFAGNLVLARLLFPDDFGTFAFVAAAVELLSIPAGLAFAQGIIQMPEEPEVEDTAFRLTLWLCLGVLMIGAAAAGIAAAARGALPGLALLVVLAARLLTVLSYVLTAPLEREFRYRGLAAVRLGSSVGAMASAIALAWAGAGVWSLVGREVVLAAATYAGLRVMTRWRYGGGYHPRTARRLFALAWRILATRVLEIVGYRGDIFALGALSGAVVLGFYDRARFVGELGYYAVSFAAVQVALPLYATLKHDQTRLGEAYRVTHYFLVRLLMPFALVLLLLPRELLTLLLGARWEPAVPALRWLAGYAFLLPILDNIKVMLTAIGRLRHAFSIRVVQTGTLLCALLLLVPRWGAVGAAAAMTLAAAAAAAAAYGILRAQRTDVAFRIYTVPLIGALGAGLLASALRAWVDPGRGGGAVGLALTVLGYLAVLLLLDRAELLRNLALIRPVGRTASERPL